MLGCWMSGHKPFSGPPSRKRLEKCVIEPLTFLETWLIIMAVTTCISLGGGNLRYRALIAPSILSVPVVSAVGAGADAGRTSLANERKPSDLGGWYEAVSNCEGGALCAEQVYEVLQGGASATIVTSEGAGFYHHAMPKRKEWRKA
jgi:hypothetical protein